MKKFIYPAAYAAILCGCNTTYGGSGMEGSSDSDSDSSFESLDDSPITGNQPEFIYNPERRLENSVSAGRGNLTNKELDKIAENFKNTGNKLIKAFEYITGLSSGPLLQKYCSEYILEHKSPFHKLQVDIFWNRLRYAESTCKELYDRQKHPFFIFLLARLHEISGNLNDAEKLYRDAIDRGLTCCDCYVGLGNVLRKKVGEGALPSPKDAIMHFMLSLNENFDDDLLYDVVELLDFKASFGDFYDKALIKNKECINVYRAHADLCYSKGDYKQAISYAKRAREESNCCSLFYIDNSSNDSILLKSLVITKQYEEIDDLKLPLSLISLDSVKDLMNKRKYEEVIRLCEYLLKREPEYNQYHFKTRLADANRIRGNELYNAKEYEKAENYFRSAISLYFELKNEKSLSDVYFAIVRCLHGQKKFNEALKYCGKIKEEFPKNKQYIEEAEKHEKLLYHDAIGEEKLQKYFDNMKEGDLFFKKGDYEEAFSCYKQALNISNVEIQSILSKFANLAADYIKRGNLKEWQNFHAFQTKIAEYIDKNL